MKIHSLTHTHIPYFREQKGGNLFYSINIFFPFTLQQHKATTQNIKKGEQFFFSILFARFVVVIAAAYADADADAVVSINAKKRVK